eukprot:6945609-Pyramimonas_sp.AAC.1
MLRSEGGRTRSIATAAKTDMPSGLLAWRSILPLRARSHSAGRVWFLMHAESARILICRWYRRPCHGEIHSVVALGEK